MQEEFDFENDFNDNDIIDIRKKIQLTEHQKNKIKETLKKMDENMIQPQISCGKVFSGAGFASNPEKIIFKDFELGKTAIITIELINISYSFNSFKLLPLDDEIIDFFEIDYKQCGRIPAGISTPMTLKFTPMVERDYFSNLKLLSETGTVLIPIVCSTKKCVIDVSNETIDFGEVIIGQEITKNLNIENKGALSCNFKFLDQEGNSISNKKFTNLVENSQEVFENDEVKEISEKNKKKYLDFIEGAIIRNKNYFLEESCLDRDELNNSNFYQIVKKYFSKQIDFPSIGTIEQYSKKSLPFILNSKYIGRYEFRSVMNIEYKNKVEQKEILIKFTIVDLPLYTDKKVFRLEHIIEDNTFREKITLNNTSNISHKLQISNHPEINQFIEINPNLGYVQANSSFDIWIKLKMKNSIHQLNSFFKTNGKNEFNFPLKISITNMKIPIIVTLNFSLTNDTISIKDKIINFGKCFIDERNAIEISMQNNSLHPMKYGYIMLPKEISAKNNIDNLLNAEKISCEISYEAMDNYLGYREGDIFCKVITNDLTVKNQKMKYNIELVSPEIEIRPKKILFPVLPSGEKESLRFILKNNSEKENFICEWLTPPFCVSGFTIMPKVFELGKNSYITCVLEYKSEFRPYGPFSFENVEKEIGRELLLDEIDREPRSDNANNTQWGNPFLEERLKKEIENAISRNPETMPDKKKKVAQEKKELPLKKIEVKKDKKIIDEEERKRKDEEEKKNKELDDRRIKRIQEFSREAELKLFGGEIFSFDDSNGKSEHSKFSIPLCYKSITNSHQISYKTAFIEVSTACVEKTLLFEKNEIDFGDVSVQTGKTVNVTLQNKSNKNADLKIKPLIVSNCFQLVNSVRMIPPNSSFNFILEFLPQNDITYFDEFCVYTEDTRSTIRLKGRGVQPEISVNLEGGILFMGNSCLNNTVEKQMEITNKSSFDLQYEILSLNSGKKNRSGFKPFSFTPYKGCIKANSKIPIKVSFSGDHQDFLNYYEMILIDVPNQKTPNYVFISASCWNRQAYWREYFTPNFPDEKFFEKSIEQDYFTEALKVKSNSLGSNNDRIVLEFEKNTSVDDASEGSYKRKLIIGNCRLNDTKNEKNVNYEIIIPVRIFIHNLYPIERRKQ